MRTHHNPVRMVCTALTIVIATGCASGRKANSYLPIGAGALYGNNTNDGVTFTLPLSEEDAMTRVRSALPRAGYAPDSVTRRQRTVVTASRSLAGDTTMRVAVQVTSLQPSAPGSSLVITADYSTPSGKQFNRPIIQPSGSTNPLFQRLRELATVIAREP